jgi:hypothetical protein
VKQEATATRTGEHTCPRVAAFHFRQPLRKLVHDPQKILRTFGRFLKVLVNPAYLAIYREALASFYNYVGYGVYGGVKP